MDDEEVEDPETVDTRNLRNFDKSYKEMSKSLINGLLKGQDE